MKIFTLILLFALSILNADELSDAYQKEYTFLKAQKSELQSRLLKEKSFQKKEIKKAQTKVQNLQNKLVALSQSSKNLQMQIEKSSQILEDKNLNKEITASVIIQAKSLLNEYDLSVDDSKDADTLTVMNKAFSDASSLYKKLSSLHKEEGSFYLVDGTTATGEIIKVGNIAAFGLSPKASGALAPAGNGEYKIWNQDTKADASAFANNKLSRDIKLFVYENLDKDVEYAKEKTLEDTLEGGGTIGYIILALGALGLLLILLRVLLLIMSGSNVKQITNVVISKVSLAKEMKHLKLSKTFRVLQLVSSKLH